MRDRDLLETKILLRPDEVARLLRLSKRKVYQMVAMGELDSPQMGRSIRITADSVKALLRNGLWQ